MSIYGNAPDIKKGTSTYCFVNTVQPVGAMEIVGLQTLILQGMISTHSHNRLGCLERFKAFSLSRALPPGILLLQYVKQSHDVAEAASRLSCSASAQEKGKKKDKGGVPL